MKRKNIEPGTESFGLAFEHFIYHELSCHSNYSGLNYPIRFWRTSSQLEVDFILGDHEVAVEVKSTNNVQLRHLKGLKAFAEEYDVNHKIVVSNDPFPRLIGDIRVLPWQNFIKMLWAGELISK